MRTIKIIADSSANLTRLDGADFASAPLKIITPEKEFIDDVNLDAQAMVAWFDTYKGKSKTSCLKNRSCRDCGSSLFALLHTLLVSLDHLLDHLAADRACLTGGQVTVVTVSQIDTNLGSSLHLELLHSSLSLGNIQLIAIVAHSNSLLLLPRT